MHFNYHSLGRNDPCWCGSGKKYKKCHYNRENQEPLKISDMVDFQRHYGAELCLHPKASSKDCSGGICRAHSVQKVALKKIAVNSHVYGWKFDLIKHSNLDNFKPERIGINDASTFTGFCNYHDTEVFAPIETKDFIPDKEQIFLITYRALCRDLFARSLNVNSAFPFLRKIDKGHDINTQKHIQSYLDPQQEEAESGYKDILELKKEYDALLLNHDFSKIRYVLLKLQKCPDIMCCGLFAPYADFQGNLIQDLKDKNLHMEVVACSVLPTNTGGVFILSGIGKENGPCEMFLKSFSTLSQDALRNTITRLPFTCTDNLFLNPVWWDNLSKDDKDHFTSTFFHTCAPENWCDLNLFKPSNGNPHFNIQIVSKETNIQEKHK